MPIKKPAEYFKKTVPSVDNSIQEVLVSPELNTFSAAFESFKNNLGKIEVLSDFSETLDNYSINVERINHLFGKIDELKIQVDGLLKKEDLDNVMMAQLLVVEDSIREVQNKVKGINDKTLSEIRTDVSRLAEAVSNFLENDAPKYKKLIVDSEIRTSNRYEDLEKNVSEALLGIGEFVDNKYEELTETLSNINDTSVSEILDSFNLLNQLVLNFKEEEIPKYKQFIVESERTSERKLSEFDEKLTETVSDLLHKITQVEDDKSDLVDIVTKKIKEIQNIREYVVEDLKTFAKAKTSLNEKVTELEVQILRNEKHICNQNETLENIHESVHRTIQQLNIAEIESRNYELAKKIKYLEEVFEKFNEKDLVEGLLPQPQEIKTKDPLTPLDKNFVTLEQLQQHYRLFINRIQQQLSTIGGGGETRFEFLDDVDRDSIKQNGHVIQYNSNLGKFIGTSYVPGSGGVGEITIQKDNVNVGTAVTILNFSGSGISTITSSSGIATITIPSSVSETQRTVTSYIATEGQTTFEVSYNVGYVDVFLNGVKLSESQYIATDGNSIFIIGGASSDDIVEIIAFVNIGILESYAAGIVIRNENIIVGSSVTSLNFVGTGVSVAVIGNDSTISITGGETYWKSAGVGIHTSSNVGIGTTNPVESLTIGGNILVNDISLHGSVTATTFTTSNVGVHSSLSSLIYRSAEYTIQASQGSNFHLTKLLVVHDGSTAYFTEYGTVYNNPVSKFSVGILDSQIYLFAVPTSDLETKYKINFIAMKI